MSPNAEPIRDLQGRVMFYCSSCGLPLTEDDFFHIGMRMPRYDETAEEYLDAELLDRISHDDCMKALRAG
jgi:hypothetical protein